MPQMAPMNWTLMFTTFILIYLVSMTLIYFTSKPSLATHETSADIKSANITWKW